MKKLPIRVWISIATFVLIAAILLASRREIAQAWHLIGQIDWWVLLLAVPLVLIGHVAVGEMIFSYLRQKRVVSHVSLWTQMRVSLELNFVNHILPSGGLSGVSYMNWRLGKFGVSVGRATMAQAVRYAVGFIAMVILLVISVFLVTLDGMVNRWLILMSSGLVGLMIVAILVFIFLMNSVPRLRQFAEKMSRFVNRLVGRLTFGRLRSVLKPAQVEGFLIDLHDDYAGLMRDKKILWQPLFWGIFYTIADIAVFWLIFWALGSPVNPAPILIAYGLASFMGFLVVTPGGAGAYEAVMILVLSLAGMSNGEAIAGIVVSRVIILLITIVAGYILYQQVVLRYGKRSNTKV